MVQSFRMLLLTFPRRWSCQRVAVNTPITHVLRRLGLPRSRVTYYGIPEVRTESKLDLISTLKGRPLCFGYVGRLVSLKGLPLILQAAKSLKLGGYSYRLKADLSPWQRNSVLQSMLNPRDSLLAALQKTIKHVAVVLMPSICEERLVLLPSSR
jgi:hypothetical protein